MKTRIGINGFGRIGRLTLRTILERHRNDIEVLAVNDLADTKTNAHLFKWDSVYGQYTGEVSAKDNTIVIDGKEIHVFSEREPASIKWKDYGIDIVIESTGRFTDAAKARGHIDGGGAKKVIISAPAEKEDATLVLGVNEGTYNPKAHNVISNASCTTNCVAPLVKVLHENFGISKGLMTTIHSYTNDQVILDTIHKDIRRARAAALNMIPTTTGAAKLVGRLIAGLEGKIHGYSMRVPTPTVSVIDFTCNTQKDVTAEQVNQAFKVAAGKMTDIIQYCEEKLVSTDFKGNSHSAIFEAPDTMVIGGNMVKVLAWYDNEWGYSCRLGDLAVYIAKKGL
jgi:glyceraldehyde 3-phosphate dehydrogenase